MQKFTQKYCLVSFLEPTREGFQYHYSSWPLHITLAEVFAVPLEKEELIALLAKLSSSLHAAQTTADDDTFFGPEKQVQVTLLNKNEEITSLHLRIMAELEKAGAVFNDPQFTREGFLPHVTVLRHARVHKNDHVAIKSVSLLDMFPGEDGYQRKVLKTWSLNEK
jgi:2'-5' RNA ligase